MPDKNLSERDICTKYITPALTDAGWNLQNQIREEVTFTAGRINVRGKTISRGAKKRADYILYHKNNFSSMKLTSHLSIKKMMRLLRHRWRIAIT